jgi:hypothetical protein
MRHRTLRSTFVLAAVVLAAPAGASAQTGAPAARTGLSLTPYVGVNIPTADLLNYTKQGSSTAQVTKIPIGFTFGGRLGIAVGKRVGLEGDVGYSPGSLELSDAGTKVNQDVKTLTGSGRVTFYLIPRTSPLWIGVSGGVGAVRHTFAKGGAADLAGVTPNTSVGGVLGASAGIRLGRVIAFNVGAEDYLYNAKFDQNGQPLAAKKQHDIRLTGGIRIPFLGL